ncbi:MAG TPA: DUF1549 and DUF1553 domain-containing protein [Pirellulaceae bacterium]|jgi:hypothetical protein
MSEIRTGMQSLLIVLAVIVIFCDVQAQEPVADTPVAKIPIDTTPIVEPPITSADRSHWSFQPIRRADLPSIHSSSFSIHNSIDAFIRAKLAAKSIEPRPEAPRHTLVRRLSFDLTGLPPTPDELVTFVADNSPDAYERLADRLLASPAFGQRYGQYWLDLARFAETDGYEHDKVRPQAWKYRDWVIAALNSDMPYDEFIRQQLAGDEEDSSRFKVQGSRLENSTLNFEPGTLNSLVATMFCLSGGDMPDVNDQSERRHNLLNEMTATVGSVFLGLQLGCAQCHNHKYDPLSQADFYRLRAVFEPAVAILKRDVPYNILVNQKEPPTARLWIRGDHKRPGLELQPDFPRIATIPTRSVSEGAVASIADHSPRSALAAWLTNLDNPLTSRVIANRLWQFHFGRGICTTPSDFGVMGAQPTHPELLDYLATELRDHNWEMKRLNRLIVTSATYRQGSAVEFKVQSPKFKVNESNTTLNFETGTLNASAADPDNSLYSSFPRQRLSGEAIRDAMLSAAGLLSSEWQGPSVMPPLPDELLSTLLKGQWTISKREADHYKRSIYVFARRNLRYPIFEAFDRPDGNASCPVRNKSTTAPQSLLLFNSELSLLTARHLAGRILSSEGDSEKPADEIDRLYTIALSRHPTSAEAKTLESFLANQQQRLSAEGRNPKELALSLPHRETTNPYAAAALVDACLALMNTSEFLYVD